MMPVMDGFSFLEILADKHPNDWARIPLFVMTAKGGPKAERERLRLPVEIVHKPVDLDELLAIIGRHCGAHRAA
jgi:CheY-like chemotaxis protein